ncbi:MAG: ABC transporter permease [Candidatus Dormibacter sp.]|uniref:ABC transporter permease n=1 Tax=Candidatus Dormibacter sp. TaxID=2973982 RepID=UPI000DB410F2|nr:MAG: ABC transporter permease [Candidatus Dormibacteraeota bacterium]
MVMQVLSRLAVLLLSLMVASMAVFAVVNVLPGDPAAVILGTSASPQQIADLHRQLGLDRPAWLRYLEWLGGLIRGDFGVSLISKQPILPELQGRALVSVPLALFAMFLALAVSIPLGIVAGVRYRSLSGSLISALSLGGIAIPAFWAGLLLVTIFAVQLHVLPAGSFVPWEESPVGALRSLLLPSIALGLVQGAVLTRYIRSAVIEVQREDYIRTARSKGLTRGQALRRHGLKNAAIPVVTILGLQLTSLLVGAVVIENVFYLPGLGRMLLDAVRNRDLIEIQDLILLLTATVLVINFATDLSYRLLDPRIRASR